MQLNGWVESEAFGRLRVQHTEVPQAQQKPEVDVKQNLGFSASEQHLIKNLQTLWFLLVKFWLKVCPTYMASTQLCIKSPAVLLRDTGDRWQHYLSFQTTANWLQQP